MSRISMLMLPMMRTHPPIRLNLDNVDLLTAAFNNVYYQGRSVLNNTEAAKYFFFMKATLIFTASYPKSTRWEI